jgi:type II secretory pathway pseudopilin PulG
MISPRRAPGRSGATLTEVLMSLLIMSIGIVSVITMFPLAVLRSIQATQLTNSRLLKQNVQQAFRTQYYSPDRPLLPAPSTGAAFRFDLMNQSTFPRAGGPRTQFRGEWQPNTSYLTGEIIVPTRKAGGTAPSPNLWFVCQGGGVSGEIEPRWQPGLLLSDGTMDATAAPPTGWLADIQDNVNTAFPAPAVSRRPFQPVLLNGVYYDALNYVVDPLGWAMFLGDLSLNGAVTSANDFGYFSTGSIGGAVAPANYPDLQTTLVNHRLLRVNGGLTDLTSTSTARALAEGIGMNGDTWITEVTSLVDSVAPVGPLPGNRSAVFPSTVDLTAIAQANAGEIRIVFRNVADNQSAVRILDSIDLNPAVDVATRTVRWHEPLPAGFLPDGEARLERVDKRYSWLATVNKTPQGSTNVTVAIFAKRSFTPDDEHVYRADFTTGLADQATITWGPSEPTPLIREGNYVLDGYTARWYRVIAVSGKDSPVTVTFDEKVPVNHRVAATPSFAGRLIFMRGIVELFEL